MLKNTRRIYITYESAKNWHFCLRTSPKTSPFAGWSGLGYGLMGRCGGLIKNLTATTQTSQNLDRSRGNGHIDDANLWVI
ncbi:hypothetical protein ACN38_g3026 [Penicillium nordicum]|uniref:Uncharacterized protein n=1 Tax=Penicillium nordicum TaxID=229535 RepID=A0A0M9WIE6_9EURO|nr:hypothetical protein ACN38_g3026 [Penicillium nordicum]